MTIEVTIQDQTIEVYLVSGGALEVLAKLVEAQAAAEAAASDAQNSAIAAQGFADATAIAAAAKGVYDTIAEGIADTVDGESFYVTDAGSITLYKNNLEVADPVAFLATAANITALQSEVAARVPYTELASTAPGEGAALVGWIRNAIGAFGRTLADWLDDQNSVMDFIPFVERVRIRLRTSNADLSPYFDAAINYTLNTRGGGTLHIPSGTYNLATAVTIDSGVYTTGIILQGEGRNTVINQTGTGEDAFHFSTTQYLQNSGFKDMRISCDADAGHVINIIYGCTTSFLTNVDLAQANPAKSLIYGDWSTFGGGVYDTKFSGGSWYCAELSTVPGVQFIARGTIFNENIFENLRCYNAKIDQFFHISMVAPGAQWLNNNKWKNINFEICNGGGIYFESFKNCSMDGISFWDSGGAYVNNLIEMGGGAGIESASNTLANVGRNGNALTPGIFDIKITAGQDTTMINCYTQNGDGPAYDFGNKRINIIGAFAGTTTNDVGVFQLGSQFGEIKFPGTVNDTYLTYYDEGTWTATMTGTGAAPTTPVTTTGQWTRIGRLVTISAEFVNVDTTGASGNVVITGLPFTVNATYRSVGSAATAGFGTNVASPRAAGAQIEMFRSNARTTNITHADGGAGTGKHLSISTTYIVA